MQPTALKTLLVAALSLGLAAFNWAEEVNTRQQLLVQQSTVQELMLRVAAFQERDFGGEIHTDWKAGTYYSGLYACYLATGDENFRRQALEWCEAAKWTLSKNHFFADDICSAQTFLDVYLDEKEPHMIANTIAALEPYFTQETINRKDLGGPAWKGDTRPFTGRNVWWWCDSLYMAPPVLTRLYSATGDHRYIDLLNSFYWDSVDFLFNTEDDLFSRDQSYFNRKTPNGKPIYWSRGNGWVYAGIIRTLDHLPSDDPHLPQYLELFEKMTRSLVALQQEDGLWRPSINDPSWKTIKESSGTSFYCYGLLAGINRGYLDKAAYLPVALKAWDGLLSCINSDGRMGYAQLVAGGPAHVRPSDSIDYAHGAFLLAASELYKMNLRPADFAQLDTPYEVKLLSRDATWTADSNEPVVYDGSGFYIASVDSEGQSRTDYYSTVRAQSPHAYRQYLFSAPSSTPTQNTPALLQLTSGELLAAYAADSQWNSSKGEKQRRPNFRTVKWDESNPINTPAQATNAHLAQLFAEEGLIFNFSQSKDGALLLSLSKDGAKSWSKAYPIIHSTKSETLGSVKYTDNGKDRIDIALATTSPSGSSKLYHLFYQAGSFFHSNGKMIRTLSETKNQAISPADATLVYQAKGKLPSFVWDLEYDPMGQPNLAFADETARYQTATWNSKTKSWSNAPVALASEQSLAGGITLDPNNADQLYLSSKVDPITGKANSTGRYQVYRGQRSNGNWTYQQLTFDAQTDNVLPLVPRNHDFTTVALWAQSDIYKAKNSPSKIVGIFE